MSEKFSIEPLLRASSELTHRQTSSVPVVLMTRIRLARNLSGFFFPNRASDEQRMEVRERCLEGLKKTSGLRRGSCWEIEKLSGLERRILVERHLISRELSEGKPGGGVIINAAQTIAVMINEEDHLRIQAMVTGLDLAKVWKQIDALDSGIEGHLDYAFHQELGYLTACPTNVGTGMRASAMMHLPALVISGQMEKVVRAVAKLGLVVRGLFGEGSDATGSIFQVSNQKTLGESESIILNRLQAVLRTIVQQEQNARLLLLQNDRNRLLDRIGRAFGILRNGHVISSDEAMAMLSLVRMAVDFGMFPGEVRGTVDRLLIEAQPGHLQYWVEGELESAGRDTLRAEILRKEMSVLPDPDFRAVA